MWGAISASARNLGDSAANQAKKAKIKTDIVFIDRSIDNRKRAFGVAMYDYLSPLSQSQNFYAASDKLTELVRPTLIIAQKEIQALAARRVKQKEALAMAEANRAGAFPTKADTYGRKLMNFGKAGYLHGGETKIKTELSVTERLIKGHKEDFGVALYNAFADAEDNDGFLPTDRQIRNIYDTCRQDLTSLEQQKKAKKDEIVELGGKRISSETPTVEETTTNTNTTTTASNDYTSSSNSYGATTASQSAPFPTTAHQPPAASSFMPPTAPTGVAVAGTGMFSHPVPSSSGGGGGGGGGGFSDNPSSGVPHDPFANNNNNPGYNPNPSMPMPTPTSMSMNSGAAPAVDPFSIFDK